jgi:hypothetical protein
MEAIVSCLAEAVFAGAAIFVVEATAVGAEYCV